MPSKVVLTYYKGGFKELKQLKDKDMYQSEIDTLKMDISSREKGRMITNGSKFELKECPNKIK